VGGDATGALLVLLPLSLLIGASSDCSIAVAFALGLAVGYDPRVGLCACAGSMAFAAPGVLSQSAPRTSGRWRPRASGCGLAFLLGLAPLAIALIRVQASGVPVASALASAWSGEHSASRGGSPFPFVAAQIGPVLAILALAGAGLASLVSRARPLACGLAVIALLGFAFGWMGVPAGPRSFGAPILAALLATSALAGIAMQAIVRSVARARVPFARESASMVLLLVLVLPVDRLDDALSRPAPRVPGAAEEWSDAALGSAPPRSFVIATDPRIRERLKADRARGAIRGDVTLLPASIRSPGAGHLLAADASLISLWRDLALVGAPSEASLSAIATRRPVIVMFDPSWGRSLARHLLPLGLFDRFEPEPRGASDRRAALDAFASERDGLALAARSEPEFAAVTASLLRAREKGIALAGDRGSAARALRDADAFEPRQP
ncbi:MAG: hypothetical protein ACREJ3_05220, partial [Polyangiaceae bacterium]